MAPTVLMGEIKRVKSKAVQDEIDGHHLRDGAHLFHITNFSQLACGAGLCVIPAEPASSVDMAGRRHDMGDCS